MRTKENILSLIRICYEPPVKWRRYQDKKARKDTTNKLEHMYLLFGGFQKDWDAEYKEVWDEHKDLEDPGVIVMILMQKFVFDFMTEQNNVMNNVIEQHKKQSPATEADKLPGAPKR